ncbi:MAG: hypothetical protein HC897_06360 [Thermoanaerobaculia bacterium]|nr:hypothetical protein [Thermoanaerobaculia bacterium]
MQQKTLGAGLSGTTTFDAVRRPIKESLFEGAGLPTFQESVAWSPRNLKIGQSRGDLNQTGLAFGYDGAKRLTLSAKVSNPLASLGNNAIPNPAALTGQPDVERFGYDAAQNLLSRAMASYGIESETNFPNDASGRNRPAAIDGISLQWDANGNLISKGDLRLGYDYRNRLTRVTDAAGNEIETHAYDIFNRRVKSTAAGETRETTWDGLQPVEDYKDGQLESRRVYGLGIDETVRLETDLDGDGTLEPGVIPIFDSTGNLALVANEQGKPIERYRYTAYGEQKIFVDLTPPQVEQVRIKAGEIWLELSEEVLKSELQKAIDNGKLKLVETATNDELELSFEQPVQTGRQARRRVVIAPTEPPVEGTELRLTLEPPALVDLFHNRPAAAFEQTFTWPAGDQLLQDSVAPTVDAIRLRGGVLEIELSEPADLSSAEAALEIDEATATWTLAEDGYTLVAGGALTPGTHNLTIGIGALDLDGKGLVQVFAAVVIYQAAIPDAIVFEAPDPNEVSDSTIGNRFGFHGLPRDAGTGLVYMRNRYFDPQLGRFITADPLGFVDGPSVYGFAGYSPGNYSDPLGLETPQVKIYPEVFEQARKSEPASVAEERAALGAEFMRTTKHLAIGALKFFPCLFATLGAAPSNDDPREYGCLPMENRGELAGAVVAGLATSLIGPRPERSPAAVEKPAAVSSGPKAGPELDVSIGANSRLVPGGGLAAHEAAGGHLLSKHVGQTKSALAARLEAEPNIPAASTFLTRAEAEAGVSAVLDAQAAQLSAWESSGAKGQLVLKAPFNGGVVLERGATTTNTGSGVIVVLRGTGGGGWRIQTGYPVP